MGLAGRVLDAHDSHYFSPGERPLPTRDAKELAKLFSGSGELDEDDDPSGKYAEEVNNAVHRIEAQRDHLYMDPHPMLRLEERMVFKDKQKSPYTIKSILWDRDHHIKRSMEEMEESGRELYKKQVDELEQARVKVHALEDILQEASKIRNLSNTVKDEQFLARYRDSRKSLTMKS